MRGESNSDHRLEDGLQSVIQICERAYILVMYEGADLTCAQICR